MGFTIIPGKWLMRWNGRIFATLASHTLRSVQYRSQSEKSSALTSMNPAAAAAPRTTGYLQLDRFTVSSPGCGWCDACGIAAPAPLEEEEGRDKEEGDRVPDTDETGGLPPFPSQDEGMLAEEEEGRDADGDEVPGGVPASPLIPEVRRRRAANDICEMDATLSSASSSDCTPATVS